MTRILSFPRQQATVVITDVVVIQNGPFAGQHHGICDGVRRKLHPHEVDAFQEAARLRVLAASIKGPVEFDTLLLDFPDGPHREAARALLTPMLSFSMPDDDEKRTEIKGCF